MPLQTSRYLTMFSLVIVCICGFTLLDQFAGPTKLADDSPSPRRRSVRTTRSLQPGPPVEPQWVQPAQEFASDGYDYPSGDYLQMTEVPVQAATFSSQTQAVDFAPVAQSAPVQDIDLFVKDNTVPVATTTVPAVDEFSFDEFAPGPATQPETPPQLPELPGPDFGERSEAVWSDDANLGPASSDPWGEAPKAAEPVPSGDRVAVMEVDQPEDSASVLPADDVSIRDTLDETRVVVAGFAAPREPKPSADPQAPERRRIDGSYRIRSLTVPQRKPKRLRGTFRFSAPAVETPAPAKRDSAVTPAAATKIARPTCQHKRAAGQRVCPRCGVIHGK